MRFGERFSALCWVQTARYTRPGGGGVSLFLFGSWNFRSLSSVDAYVEARLVQLRDGDAPKIWLRWPMSGTYFEFSYPEGLYFGEWTHLAFTYDGTAVQLFVNGQLWGGRGRARWEQSPQIDGRNWAIKVFDVLYYSTNGPAGGAAPVLIDDLGFFLTALDQSAVQAFMAHASPVGFSLPAELAAGNRQSYPPSPPFPPQPPPSPPDQIAFIRASVAKLFRDATPASCARIGYRPGFDGTSSWSSSDGADFDTADTQEGIAGHLDFCTSDLPYAFNGIWALLTIIAIAVWSLALAVLHLPVRLLRSSKAYVWVDDSFVLDLATAPRPLGLKQRAQFAWGFVRKQGFGSARIAFVILLGSAALGSTAALCVAYHHFGQSAIAEEDYTDSSVGNDNATPQQHGVVWCPNIVFGGESSVPFYRSEIARVNAAFFREAMAAGIICALGVELFVLCRRAQHVMRLVWFTEVPSPEKVAEEVARILAMKAATAAAVTAAAATTVGTRS